MKINNSRILGFLLMGIGLVLISFGIYGVTRPNEYRARAKIWLPASDVSRSFSEAITREVEVIRSELFLSNVVFLYFPPKQANEGYEGEMTKMISNLRNRIEVRQILNAKLLEICAADKTPDSAARTANIVADAYKVWKFNDWLTRAASVTAELKQQIEAQDRKIQTCTEALQLLKAKLQISDAGIAASNATTNYPEFYQAQRNLDDAKDVRMLIAQKMNASEAYKTGPMFSIVEMVERAVPPRSPHRHKKLLSIFLIVTGVVFCVWGKKFA